MRSFTKNLLMLCGIYVFTQISGHNIVFAANNIDKLSVETSTTTEITNTLASDKNKAKNEVVVESVQGVIAESSNDINENSNIGTITKYDIPVNKKWEIKFSQPININSISDKIKVIDEKTKKEIPISMSLEKNNRSIVISLIGKYNPESEYSLTIDKGIASSHNKKLKEPITMKFKTSASITSIEDINTTINQEDEFNLPSQVNAIMSNGKTTLVNISWNRPVDITSIPGNYTYKGTVDGYDKTVTLNLTIKPFEPVKSISNGQRTQSAIQTNLYNYLMNYDNRQAVMQRAVELHNGDYSNNCVYFASEALRRAGLSNLPESVANTRTLTSKLKAMGWKVSTDLSNLMPGDICFTTSYGYGPTHAYTFMKWVDPNSHDYAYICDNQGNEYGNVYHKRNVSFATVEKDAISYFMYLP